MGDAMDTNGPQFAHIWGKSMPVAAIASVFASVSGYVIRWWHAKGVTEVQFQAQLEILKVEMRAEVVQLKTSVNASFDSLRKDLQVGEDRWDREEIRITRDDASIRSELKELKGDIRGAVSELHLLGTMLQRIQGEQNAINIVTGKALESLLNKIAENTHNIDQNASLLIAHTKIVTEHTQVMQLVHATIQMFDKRLDAELERKGV